MLRTSAAPLGGQNNFLRSIPMHWPSPSNRPTPFISLTPIQETNLIRRGLLAEHRASCVLSALSELSWLGALSVSLLQMSKASDQDTVATLQCRKCDLSVSNDGLLDPMLDLIVSSAWEGLSLSYPLGFSPSPLKVFGWSRITIITPVHFSASLLELVHHDLEI